MTERVQARSPSILLLAGEPSGDLHAAAVAHALRNLWPDCRLLGMGGERMAAAGVELLADLGDLAVMGFVEVASRLPFFWQLERKVSRILRSGEIDLLIPVDYPGFNLRMTERASASGVPVVYYIAPQVWAWKAGRTERLSRAADRIALILPFEEEIFRRAGGAAEFVGHPLLDRDLEVPSREDFCAAAGLDPTREILALFPGSRNQEVRRHLEPFLEAGALLRKNRPGLQLVLAQATTLSLAPSDESEAVTVEDGVSLLAHARAAIVKSGTTTLEAALAGTPFIVAYQTHPLTFWLARRLVQVDHIALANLVAGSRVVPELLQAEMTPRSLAEAVEPMLEEGRRRSEVLAGLAGVREQLGGPGAAARVAELAAAVLEGRAPPSDAQAG